MGVGAWGVLWLSPCDDPENVPHRPVGQARG